MEKDNKRIVDVINNLMVADSLEQAPANFTDSVMSKIDALSTSKVIVYKPLIPKYIWWLIAVGFVALVSYIVFKQPSNTVSFLERYNLPKVSFNPLEGMSYDFSNILMYATVFFAIMVSIQIPLLKQYFNNNISY